MIVLDPDKSSLYLDLRNTPCPLNLIRIRLALETLEPSSFLEVDLDRGEPEEMVIPSLKNAGHHVEIISQEISWIKLLITKSGG